MDIWNTDTTQGTCTRSSENAVQCNSPWVAIGGDSTFCRLSYSSPISFGQSLPAQSACNCDDYDTHTTAKIRTSSIARGPEGNYRDVRWRGRIKSRWRFGGGRSIHGTSFFILITDACNSYMPFYFRSLSRTPYMVHITLFLVLPSLPTCSQHASRVFVISFDHTPQSVGLLWTRDRPMAETSTWQHKHCTRQTSMPRWDSNSQSKQALGRRP
jgi:hypothetical protein